MSSMLNVSATNSSSPLSATWNYFAEIPNPLNAGMNPLPTTLNIISLALKNIAYFQAGYQLLKSDLTVNSDPPNKFYFDLKYNYILLGVGITCDTVHTLLHIGKDNAEKATYFLSSLAGDAIRVGTVAAQHFFSPAISLLQLPESLFQMVYQTEINYDLFNDVPSKEGNLYRAILANDAKLVDRWSRNVEFLNKMGEGGPAGVVPALFIAAMQENVDLEVMKVLIANGADPECRFVDPKSNYQEYSILAYVQEKLEERGDLRRLLEAAIEDKKLAESHNTDERSLLVNFQSKGVQQIEQNSDESSQDPNNKKDEL